jgi:hypothetical protein
VTFSCLLSLLSCCSAPCAGCDVFPASLNGDLLPNSLDRSLNGIDVVLPFADPLSRLLPACMVMLLRQSGPLQFMAVFNSMSHESADVVWNARMRFHLMQEVRVRLSPAIEWLKQPIRERQRLRLPPPAAMTPVPVSTWGAATPAPVPPRASALRKPVRIVSCSNVSMLSVPGLDVFPKTAPVHYLELQLEPCVAGLFLRFLVTSTSVRVLWCVSSEVHAFISLPVFAGAACGFRVSACASFIARERRADVCFAALSVGPIARSARCPRCCFSRQKTWQVGPVVVHVCSVSLGGHVCFSVLPVPLQVEVSVLP